MFDDVKKGEKLKKKQPIKSKTTNYEKLIEEFKEQYQKYNAKYNAIM